ncbi:MAG: bifunctional cobalt-precorrin 5A hydrolase/precorrin-3B C(17)-methyltransferase [Rhodobacteraceae bacterium]|nr:bifunctional cobalt-precorrin 5A hydrolase/precorrin-3B C(17)-methyltransferase [Paracoccaceae bacterium]
MAVTPAIICLSAAALPLADRIATALGGVVHCPAGTDVGTLSVARFDGATAHIRDLFAAQTPIIGLCASGILIRAVAPLLAAKRDEPPVLAVAANGAAVVPLLGGHNGANNLATQIADLLAVPAAVTTAGEAHFGVALDEPPAGWRLENPQDAKAATAALLAGAGVRFSGDMSAPWLQGLPQGDGPAVHICLSADPAPQGALISRPLRAVLGVGCARNCPPQELIELVEAQLKAANIAPGALRAITSLDLKADEAAIHALAAHLDVPFRLFDAAALEAETTQTPNPSEVVFAEVGTHGVAENAALAGAGPKATLIAPKRKTAMATAAIALAPEPLTALPGVARGQLSIVGIGPGQAAWRTPEASQLIAQAEELVGYGLYIDLLGPLAHGKERADFPLGGEEDRCRHALEQAGKRRNVALICSGDAGIYAMGALVWELIGRGDGPGGVSGAARRAHVTSAPGITAMQAASARAGALLGHDFCAISLSDLLTPRADILRRITAAAEGDFVIGFYNPVSRSRRTLLAQARDILLEHRPGDTPVLLASSLGRPEELLRHRHLADLEVDEVDMLTIVLIGSSNSKLVETGEGPRIFTPRGYAKKLKERLA